MSRSVNNMRRGDSASRIRIVFAACLLACAARAGATLADESPKEELDSHLVEQLSLAKQGNVWAKYELFTAYRGGKHGVQVDLRQADRWLGEIVRGLHLVTFAPTNGFRPATPQEFLAKFNEHSALRSGSDGIGGASFFRTKRQGGTLIASFLTETPDKMVADIKHNPQLTHLWTAEVTPAIFVMHESAEQESLPTAPQEGKSDGKKKTALDRDDSLKTETAAPQGQAAKLKITDLQKGTGAVAERGKTVVVHYRGTLTDGKDFDSSRKHGAPFSFALGAGHVISGWEQGIQGMKVGGKRKLVIPPHLGYGTQGAGGVIPPNATLVFEVELLEVK